MDVSAEAHSVFRIIKADLFVLALVLSSTFGLAWSYFQYSGSSGLSVLFLVLIVLEMFKKFMFSNSVLSIFSIIRLFNYYYACL